MTEPNIIPRTLKGVGGTRLIDHPGVHYPLHVLQAAEGMNKRTGKPYDEPPLWAISTKEASELLCLAKSNTRSTLLRHGVSYALVRRKSGLTEYHWRLSEVKELAGKRPPLSMTVPPGMVDTKAALVMLNVKRSSLYRYVQQGRLRQQRYRIMTARGCRTKLVYYLSEVRRLATHMRSIRCHQECISTQHQHYVNRLSQIHKT